jgi:glyoxylase-like metal-dependent hydrolase (beta-lactamase superfamily II)
MSSTTDAVLHFPRATAPDPGTLTEIAPGVLWLRIALPFALNHVNVYLIEDGAGWALVDTGVNDDRTRTMWTTLLKGRVLKKKITRVIGTHFHPDHIGLAGWIVERCGVELSMSQTEFFFAQTLLGHADALHSPVQQEFFRQRGLDAASTEALTGRGHAYLQLTSPLQPTYRRLVAGDTLRIGGRSFEILTGAGHAPEQVMLLCRADRIFLSADQVLAGISPNISVWPWEKEADPLGAYLASLEHLHEVVPDRALVLGGHNLPFVGLHDRVADLANHHERRCAEIVAACRTSPMTAAELVPVIFRRKLDAQQTGFAFGEVVAHVNYLRRLGELAMVADRDGTQRYVPGF